MLTAWIEASESELTQALEQISGPVSLTPGVLPLVVLERTSRQKAEWARDLLVRAGGTVSMEEVWVTREEAGDLRPRFGVPFVRFRPHTAISACRTRRESEHEVHRLRSPVPKSERSPLTPAEASTRRERQVSFPHAPRGANRGPAG